MSGFQGLHGTSGIYWYIGGGYELPYRVRVGDGHKDSNNQRYVLTVEDVHGMTVMDAWVPNAEKDKAIEWLLDYAGTRLGVELKLEG